MKRSFNKGEIFGSLFDLKSCLLNTESRVATELATNTANYLHLHLTLVTGIVTINLVGRRSDRPATTPLAQFTKLKIKIMK